MRWLKRILPVALTLPALLFAQEPNQQGAVLSKWKAEQVAIAESNEVARARSAEQTEKALANLERRQEAVFHAFAANYKTNDIYGDDPGYIKTTGDARRGRLVEDAKSAAGLDSVRRARPVAEILQALLQRREDVTRFGAEARLHEANWKELLIRFRRGLDQARADDKPSNAEPLRRQIKDAIQLYERLVRLGHDVVDFEGKRAAAMQQELIALVQQIEAGKMAQ